MQINLCRLVILLLVIGATTAFAQEQERKPESISTEPELLYVTLKAANDDRIKVKGLAVFTLTDANSDDTLTGALVYTIPDDDRRRIAQAANKSLSEIPESVTIRDVNGWFEKKASCPDLRFEFSAKDFEIAGLNAHLERYSLTFRETSRELSKLLCLFARPLKEKGGVLRRINRILKGEKEEQ